MASSLTNQAEKIKLKNKELFTDAFNICKKLLIEEDCYINDRENNSFSHLSIVYGHKMYKAMIQALNSITASNVQLDKIEISNKQLKQAPVKRKPYNNLVLDANHDQEQINYVARHSSKNQDDIPSKPNGTTVDFIQPKKKFKPNENTLNNVNKNQEIIKTYEQIVAKKIANDKKNHKDNHHFLNFKTNWDQKQINNRIACHMKKNLDNILSNNNDKKSCCDSLKKTKHEASEKKWNVKIPIELMQSIAARKNSNIKLETGESTQDKSRHTNNMINALKITTQSNGTLKNDNHEDVDKSTGKSEGSLIKNIENIDNKRVTRISTGLLTQRKYFDDKSKMSKNKVDNSNLLEKLDLSQNVATDILPTKKLLTVEMAQKNQMKEFKNSQLKVGDKQYNNRMKYLDMMELINQWVHRKCIEHQNKEEKFTTQDLKNWGMEAKKSLMFGHLRFSASDKWCTKFKEVYKISGTSRDLKITLNSANE